MGHGAPLHDGHQIRLIEGGQAYFDALVAALDQARRQVHLETYIFDFHGAAAQVAEALERAALRGLRVWVVVDGVGTPQLPPEWQERFLLAGVAWRVYSPLGTLGLLVPSRWRRLHRKLCVIDGELAFLGASTYWTTGTTPITARWLNPAWTLQCRHGAFWSSKCKRPWPSCGGGFRASNM